MHSGWNTRPRALCLCKLKKEKNEVPAEAGTSDTDHMLKVENDMNLIKPAISLSPNEKGKRAMIKLTNKLASLFSPYDADS